MALKKFDASAFLEGLKDRYVDSCIEDICQMCQKEKPIPALRREKICDECLDSRIESGDEEQKKRDLVSRLNAQRIPERYRFFDFSKLETSREVFDEICRPGHSLAISGERGTGKTNLACQILVRRATGQFYSILEMNTKSDYERIMDLTLLCVDDLTKMDSTNEKRLEKTFELFNYRYRERKDTIITLDTSYEEFERIFSDIFGTALVSRFREWMMPIVLTKKWR